MGEDTSDDQGGPSKQAHRAQDPDPLPVESRPHGLIKRLFAAFKAGEDPAPVNGVPAPPSLGLSNLRVKRVEDVAVPRVEIVSVAHNIKLDELVEVFRDSGLTRLPVFKETLDTPIGMIHLKDLSLKHGFNGKGGGFSLSKMIRPVLFVPPSMPIGVLLQKMQTERTHMALVVDEFGGVDGLVTIEDLIEQVVGEIADEHDVEEADLWKLESTGRYLAQSRAPLEEFEIEIAQKLVDEDVGEDVDTLGGLVIMLTGRVPARGEVVKLPGGAEIEIVDADPRRIKRLRVILPDANG